MKRIVLLILFALLGVVIVTAQNVDDQGNPNDPTINEDANACFGEGSMSGLCDTDWEWTCGWYLIRFEYSMISRDNFPQTCSSLLPEAPADPIVPDPPLCITNGTSFDIEIILPAFDGNATVGSYAGGTCTGTVYFSTTIVVAADVTDAANQCAALGFFNPPYDLTNEGMSFGYFDCETGP